MNKKRCKPGEFKVHIYMPFCIFVLILLMYPAASQGYEIKYFEMSGNNTVITDLSAYEDRIAWISTGYYSDDLTGLPAKLTAVTFYDINNESGKILKPDYHPKRSLAMDGGHASWLEENGSETDIYLYSQSSGSLLRLHSSSRKGNLVFVGNELVWSEGDGNGTFRILAYNIFSGEVKTVIRNITEPGILAANDDEIAFTLPCNVSDTLDFCTISGGNLSVITETNSTISSVSFDRDIIVWCEEGNGSSAILMKKIIENSTTIKLGQGINTGYPSTYGDNIMWVNDSVYPHKVMNYNISLGKTWIMYSGRERIEFSRISGSFAVWTEVNPEGICKVYYSTVESFYKGVVDQSSPDIESDLVEMKGIYGKEIVQGQSDWYSVDVPTGVKKVSFELSWENQSNSLSITLMGPDNSIQRFTKKEFSGDESLISVSLEKQFGISPGEWICIILGDSVSSADAYDLRWTDYSVGSGSDDQEGE